MSIDYKTAGFPLNNINGEYVNTYNTHNPSIFSSNTVPGLPGLAGAKNNVDAADGKVPGICVFKGGSKSSKRKIKNISKRYKMHSKRKTIKKSLKNKSKLRISKRKFSRKRKLRGGYSQYQNNLPMTPSYSVVGNGGSNIPTYKMLSNCVNCVDNYNHFTGKGFPSRGH